MPRLKEHDAEEESPSPLSEPSQLSPFSSHILFLAPHSVNPQQEPLCVSLPCFLKCCVHSLGLTHRCEVPAAVVSCFYFIPWLVMATFLQ